MFTIQQLIARKRESINGLVTTRNAAVAELDELRRQDSTDAERIGRLRSSITAAEADIASANLGLSELQRDSDDEDRLTRATQESHPTEADRMYRSGGGGAAFTQTRSRTYNERNADTFLQDLFAFSTGSLKPNASQRLLTHEQEARDAGYSERALTSTSFAGIIPPQYVLDQYAALARAGRPTANVVTNLRLPDDGMTIVVSKGTTGVSAAVQATQNTAVSNTDAVITDITVPVVTIAGQEDVSRQSIERGQGVDQIIFGDLIAAYNVALDQQVLVGTGSAGQMLGILNTAGTSQASAYSAAISVQTFFSKITGQINAIQTSRFFAPSVILMHPRRWNWLIAQLDSSNRPLVVPSGNGPTNAYAVSQEPIDTPSVLAVGSMFGLPVITDASIPTNVGTASEDQVIIARKEDLLLWEDPSAPFTLRFDQPLAGQLTVKLVAYGYAAFTTARFPNSIGIIGGNAAAGFGQIAPTF